MIEEALVELDRFLKLAKDRIDPTLETKALQRLTFADRRLTAGEQCVVALAGATGSGKSSLCNALSGTQLATVGARRPTTSSPLAISFSATNAPLLDLLEVRRRHEANPPAGFENLVLLDLPDHDSDRVENRAHVDRLVSLVDQFLFVVDPQKYADAALHEGYLRPLAGHSEVIVVVLNHADELTAGRAVFDEDGKLAEEVRPIVEHLRKLLADDGLEGVPVFVTSAASGEGVPELREHLAGISASKRAARSRLAADLRNIAAQLALAPLPEDAVDRQELYREVGLASGVQRHAEDIRRAVQRRGSLTSGDGEPLALAGRVASAAEDAGVTTAVRRYVSQATGHLPEKWRQRVREETLRSATTLPSAIDSALRAVDLTDLDAPFSWGLARLIKWLPIVGGITLALWLLIPLLTGSGLDLWTFAYAGLAVFALVLLAGLANWQLRRSARKAKAEASRRLQLAADQETDRLVVEKVDAELGAYRHAESALRRMTGILDATRSRG